MPTYPTEIPDVRRALLAYEPPANPPDDVEPEVWDKARDTLGAATGRASPVNAIVEAYTALMPHAAVLDREGASLLAGCAHLIVANAWHSLGGEALGVRDSAVARLAALGDG